jgi:polyisoprenoid-binding protein YceI
MKNLGFLLLAALSAPFAFADTYQIDPTHTNIMVKAGHIGVSKIYVMFRQMQGQFEKAGDQVSAIRMEVKADSLFSNNSQRDTHLKSPDFLNVVQYPTIDFVSSSVALIEAGKYEIDGTITLHGVSKPVRLIMEVLGEVQHPQFGDRIGLEGSLKVKRSDFGMNDVMHLADDEIEILINIEAFKIS